MKFLNALLLSLVGFASAAHSAVVVPQKNLICTRDYNAWGKASRCSCATPSTYDQRIGKCVRDEVETITVSGQIVAGLMAIGGETTGLAIRTFSEPVQQYELIVKRADFKKLSKLDGKPFEVEGEYIELHGVEISVRPAIIVKELRYLD